ncbi:metalloendopeptidase OMA1, mitochondrial-like [Watersipora subatra]|uniref:metalloendopeptidase OMA1, mitochondrial-like n=1 Tax=Watersipora subatra TaxID=2589382 RepID=UPI00355AFD56
MLFYGEYQEWLIVLSLITFVALYWYLLILLGFATTDEVNQMTGEKQVVIDSHETAVFERLYEKYLKSIMDIVQHDDPLQQKAKEMLSKILIDSRQTYPHIGTNFGKWRTIVYRSSEPQPIRALASGVIYIPSFLIENLSDDELAFLMSHAAASVLLDTQRKKYARTAIDDLAFLTVMSVVGFVQQPIYGYLFALEYNIIQSYFETAPADQKEVLLADKYALEFTARACYDIRKIPVYFAKLAEIEQQAGVGRGLHKVKTAIKSEPTFERRRQNIMNHLEEAMKIYKDSGCPKLNPENDPIVDYEIEEFEKNREQRKNSRNEL